jgi:hypothetical protein
VKAVYILPIQVTGMQQFISVAKMAKNRRFGRFFCEQSIEEN